MQSYCNVNTVQTFVVPLQYCSTIGCPAVSIYPSESDAQRLHCVPGLPSVWNHLQWSVPHCQSYTQFQEGWPMVEWLQPGILHPEHDIQRFQPEHPNRQPRREPDQLCDFGHGWLGKPVVPVLSGGAEHRLAEVRWKVHPLPRRISPLIGLQLLV